MKRKTWLSHCLVIISGLYIGGVFVIGFFPGAFPPSPLDQELSAYHDQKVEIRGRVCEEAEVDYKSRKLTVCVPGRILVTTALYPAYDYGDAVEISGKLLAPTAFSGFAYDRYLARYRVYSVMYYPHLSLADPNLSFWQKSFRQLLHFKQGIKKTIDRYLPEPEAGLADAILLGYRKTVDKDDLAMFSRVGLSHMIAISGSHITIMSAMIVSFLSAIGLKKRPIWISVFIFLVMYPLLTGLSASAVRSAIMGGMSFWSMYYRKKAFSSRFLLFSGAIMLFFNPRLLRDDIGFQLSFLAILGIIYIYPLGETLYRKLRPGLLKATLDTINLTLVSQIVILPVALINFQQLSVIAPLANVLVLWTFPPLLASLIIASVLSLIIPALGKIWFWPSFLLLKYIFSVSRLMAEPDFAAAAVSWFNWRLGICYYIILILIVVIFRRLLLKGRNKKESA